MDSGIRRSSEVGARSGPRESVAFGLRRSSGFDRWLSGAPGTGSALAEERRREATHFPLRRLRRDSSCMPTTLSRTRWHPSYPASPTRRPKHLQHHVCQCLTCGLLRALRASAAAAFNCRCKLPAKCSCIERSPGSRGPTGGPIQRRNPSRAPASATAQSSSGPQFGLRRACC